MRRFKDYYEGYTDTDGKQRDGYVDFVKRLKDKFPLGGNIISEEKQKEFILLFGVLLRMRNLLSSFDEFKGREILSARDWQDYQGRYLDIKEEWDRRKKHDKKDVTEDVVFETELIRQVEINIDYILMLVKKYHDTHCEDKEVLISIRKAIDASPELRSKKDLIENFIAGVNESGDILNEWNGYVAEKREEDLSAIIQGERLKEDDTRRYMENAFRDGEIKTAGTDIDALLPPISRFGSGARAQKKQSVIDKFKGFFERYFGIGGAPSFENPKAAMPYGGKEKMSVAAERSMTYGR